MGPRPDLRRMLVPLGPVAVWAASNFPFAFSVAGGDTASALAAGMPVVLVAHPGPPAAVEATAELLVAALAGAGAPAASSRSSGAGDRPRADHGSAHRGGRVHGFAARRPGAVRPRERAARRRSRSTASSAA